MDLSDLPASALKLIAAAEIEAKYILRESQTFGLVSTRAPKMDGEQPDSETDEFLEGRNRAARHLFEATAIHLWKSVQPDLDAFKARLNAARNWVNDKFHPAAGVLNAAAAFEHKGARREVRANRSVSEPPIRPPVGALGAALMQRRQALKEGRLDGELPSAPQTEFVPRGLSGISYSPLIRRPHTELTPQVFGGRHKRFSGAVTSPEAARRMEAYMESKGIGQTEFAGMAFTTDRSPCLKTLSYRNVWP